MFCSCIVDSSPSLNTDGNAIAKSKNATYVGWPSAKKLCWMMAMMEKIASWIWRFDLVPSWLSVSVLCCSVYCVSRLILMPSKSFAEVLLISLCMMLGLVLVSYRLYRLVALRIFATLMVVLGVPTG